MRPSFNNLWILSIGLAALGGCLSIAFILHAPIPRTHDEFSYVLMGETFARGGVTSTAPPMPEFVDSFHVLVRPVYASKYFPAQGMFLALGERINGNPALGVWLSSALACAAVTWMLQAWLNPTWGLVGGFLFVAQYGVFSYWSQSYWGGMVPALGGALFFGAIKRLWDRLFLRDAIWLAIGLVILANSRPLEGVLAALPTSAIFAHHLCRNRRWAETNFWAQFLLPVILILVAGICAMGTYNRAITGSPFKTPYMLHEEQYQESPLFLFLPMHRQLAYTNPWLSEYYHIGEVQRYLSERNPKLWPLSLGRKLATWWDFYCGCLLSIPLFVPPLLRRGRVKIFQTIFLIGLGIAPAITGYAVAWRILIDVLAAIEIVALWFTFDEFWSRLAIGTCVLVLFESFFTKWVFPHYFAPAACLVLYLQVDGLRRIWNWRASKVQNDSALTRYERRRLTREAPKSSFNLRWLVCILPLACVVSLVIRVETRLNGSKSDPHGIDRYTLLMDDWSLDRANLAKWLERQSKPQLVFVRYSPHHNVNFEWVYNHPDIMRAHVIWARDLGTDHNKLLLNLLPERTVWLLEADDRHPQLEPYEQAIYSPSETAPPAHRPTPPDQGE